MSDGQQFEAMIRRESDAAVDDGRAVVAPTAPDERPEGRERCHDGRESSLEAARCPDADQGPHEKRQVAAADLDEQPFEDVGMAAQVRAAQPAGFVEMGVGSLQPYAALAEQRQSVGPSNASAIRVDRRACRGLLLPAASTALGLGDVGPHVERSQVHQHPLAVIPLVGHDVMMPAVGRSVTAATASRSSAAAVTVSAIVVVSPWSAPWTVPLIEARVERMTRSRRQVRCGHPHRGLPVAFAFSHRHAQSVVPIGRGMLGRNRGFIVSGQKSTTFGHAAGGIQISGPPVARASYKAITTFAIL